MSRALGTPRPLGCVPGQPRTAPHRPAHASRSVPIAGGNIELPLLCAEGGGRARCRLRARPVLRVGHAESARVRFRTVSHAPAVALAAASRVCTSAPRPVTLTQSPGAAHLFSGSRPSSAARSDEFGRHACVRRGGARGAARLQAAWAGRRGAARVPHSWGLGLGGGARRFRRDVPDPFPRCQGESS